MTITLNSAHKWEVFSQNNFLEKSNFQNCLTFYNNVDKISLFEEFLCIFGCYIFEFTIIILDIDFGEILKHTNRLPHSFQKVFVLLF